jgi:hypothetical protein
MTCQCIENVVEKIDKQKSRRQPTLRSLNKAATPTEATMSVRLGAGSLGLLRPKRRLMVAGDCGCSADDFKKRQST